MKQEELLWRQIWRKNFTNWEKFADFLLLDPANRLQILKHPNFSLSIPFRLAEKIKKNCIEDPILLQFLPLQKEALTLPGFIKDPVGDLCSQKEKKLLHKYQGRVLLICTSVCAMHCRYCFRQNFNYAIQDKSFANELKLIEEDPSISEVILSGGDPLSLSDEMLQKLLKDISKIPHIKRIRFHTRFPIGIPERITENFLSLLTLPQQVWFVIHANHALELDEEVLNALKRIQKLGIPLLCQSVLLKGVNDSLEALKNLSEKLVDNGIIPYYLHQLDRVQGASHFEVEESTGLNLIKDLTKQLSGYAIPKYVKEISGEPSKSALH